mgnify:CR=1 FL=1
MARFLCRYKLAPLMVFYQPDDHARENPFRERLQRLWKDKYK